VLLVWQLEVGFCSNLATDRCNYGQCVGCHQNTLMTAYIATAEADCLDHRGLSLWDKCFIIFCFTSVAHKSWTCIYILWTQHPCTLKNPGTSTGSCDTLKTSNCCYIRRSFPWSHAVLFILLVIPIFMIIMRVLLFDFVTPKGVRKIGFEWSNYSFETWENFHQEKRIPPIITFQHLRCLT